MELSEHNLNAVLETMENMRSIILSKSISHIILRDYISLSLATDITKYSTPLPYPTTVTTSNLLVRHSIMSLQNNASSLHK